MDQPRPIETRFPDDPSVPDVYSDGVGIAAGPYGFNLIFTRGGNDPLTPTPVAVVRISPQLAYIFGRQLVQGINIYEQQFGEINLPESLLRASGLTGE